MRLGIGSYTFGWAVGVVGHEPRQPMDEVALFDAAREFGVSVVQFGDNLPLIAFDAERLARLKARAASAGITLELGGRGLTTECLKAHLDLSLRLDARLLRFVIDGPCYRPDPAQVVAALREGLADDADGPCIALENHDRFPARTMREIIEAVGSDRVGICLDTANSLGAGEGLQEVTDILAPFVLNLHIKDFTVERLPHQMGFVVEGRPAGSGMMDLPRVLERLARYGRCRSAILEAWTPPETDIEATVAKERDWAVASIEYLKRFAW